MIARMKGIDGEFEGVFGGFHLIVDFVCVFWEVCIWVMFFFLAGLVRRDV